MRTLSATCFFPSDKFFVIFRRIICTIFLCNKKHRSPCSFKSNLQTTRLQVSGNSHFEKEWTDVFALSTISTLRLSFLFLPCHKFPALFPNHAFPKRPFFSRARKGKESRHYILLPITCYYAQYRMRSAILRNHLTII